MPTRRRGGRNRAAFAQSNLIKAAVSRATATTTLNFSIQAIFIGEAMQQPFGSEIDGPLTQEALERIASQAEFVAELKPGSEAHKIATGVLLLLQDSLHAVIEAQVLLAQLQG